MNDKETKNEAFLQMLALSAGGATEKTACVREGIEWPAVVRYAQEHSVLPLIGCALLCDPNIPCPDLLRQQLVEMVRGQSGMNLVRKQRTLRLIAELEALGVDVKLIKGYALGRCYAFPECRISTDIDLLIPEEQEELVYGHLREKGFLVEPRGKTGHHAVCLHPKLGKVEVHVQLYKEIVRDAWFQGVPKNEMLSEEPVRVTDEDLSYTTLGHTDNVIFLTLHMVKHFIRSGLSVRMMIDIAQFFASHRNEIDWQRYWNLMEMLQYKTLIGSVLWAMIDTGCFDLTDFPGLQKEQPGCVALILQDLELGGNMGIKENGRIIESYEYTRLVLRRQKSPLQYRLYMLKHKLRSAWNHMFPDTEQMQTLYPVLRKQKWLMPFLRLHRMIAYPLMKIRAGAMKDQIRTEGAELPPEAKRRIEMFEALDML